MKKTKLIITTLIHADSVLLALVEQINLQRAAITERDAEILALNQRYEKELAEYDDSIETKTAALAVWADTSKEFPKAAKSLELTAGKIGFRTAPPSVALIKKSFNWKNVLETLINKKIRRFIRIKPEVDKERILAHWQKAGHKETYNKFLATLGLKIAQAEQFYIEPNLTKTETRQTQEAA